MDKKTIVKEALASRKKKQAPPPKTPKQQSAALNANNYVPSPGGGGSSWGIKYKTEDSVPVNIKGKMVPQSSLPAKKPFFQKAKTRGAK